MHLTVAETVTVLALNVSQSDDELFRHIMEFCCSSYHLTLNQKSSSNGRWRRST